MKFGKVFRQKAFNDRVETFSKIYAQDIWNGGSGPGSTPEATVPYRELIQKHINSSHVSKVVDLGCGDWQFSQFLDWSNVKYLGVDIVENVIQENRRRFEAKNIEFIKSDLVDFIPSECDLIISKDVLQHLSNSSIKKIFKNLRGTKAQIIVTNDVILDSTLRNSDTRDGGYRPLDLSLPPFQFSTEPLLEWNSNGFIKRTVLVKL
jgi:trans-aconitate methyltransferase